MRDIRSSTAGPAYATQPGLSGEHASTAIAAGANTGTASGVRQLQAFLRNKGYNVSIDGVRGPQTEAAVAAYHQGITARAWNSRSVHAGARAKPQRSTGRHVTPPARRPVGRAPARGVASLLPGTDPMAAASAATSGNSALAGTQTDEQMAQAMADAEFGPQEAEIKRQQDAVRSASAAQIANLAKWYGDIGATAKAVGAQTQQADQGLIAGQNEANQNMLQLFGGPGANGSAGEAATFADINNAALAQMSGADQSYTANLQPIIQTQGTEAQNQTQQGANAQLAELAAQLSGVTGQRGAAYTQHLSEIHQQSLDNQRAQQALDLAQSLAPSQVAEARANASLAQTKARQAPLQAARDAKSFGMSVQRYNAELAQTRAQTAKIKASLGGANGINWSDPNTRSSLFDQLRPIVQTKNGTWRMHPGAAQQNLNLALKTLGLGNDPNARAIANQLLQQTVTNSHASRMWGQFNYANGKIVKTGARFKPKSKK